MVGRKVFGEKELCEGNMNKGREGERTETKRRREGGRAKEEN